MKTLHIVGLLDHSDHRADSRCSCGPEPVRDLNEPSAVAFLHRRPISESPIARARHGAVAQPAADRPGGGALTHTDQEVTAG